MCYSQRIVKFLCYKLRTLSEYNFLEKYFLKNFNQLYFNQNTFNLGFHSSESVAIDYSTSNLYYAVKISSISSGQDMIRVVQHATFLEKTLLTNLKHPRDIALYPSKGCVLKFHTGIFDS